MRTAKVSVLRDAGELLVGFVDAGTNRPLYPLGRMWHRCTYADLLPARVAADRLTDDGWEIDHGSRFVRDRFHN